MKRPKLNCFLSAVAVSVFFSLCSVAKASNINDSLEVPEDTTIYKSEGLDSEAVFPFGSEQGLMDYLRKELKYPKEAQEAHISGKVLVYFVVEKDGSLTNVKPLNDQNKQLIAEALRVVKCMPKWTPAKKDGVPVRMEWHLPVTFRLNEAKPMGFFGPKRNKAIFGNYAKKKDFDGKDMYIFGLQNLMHQNVKITINNKLNTKNNDLESAVSQLVLGNSGTMEEAIKAFRGNYTAVKVEATKIERNVTIQEYFTKDGIACIKYDQISQKDPSVITASQYVIYDCNNSRIVTLADLVAPAVVTYLGNQGVDASVCTNIKVDGKTYLIPTPKTVITLDGEKLKANMTELGLSILGIQ